MPPSPPTPIRECHFWSKTSKLPGWEFILCFLVHSSITKNFRVIAQLIHGLNLQFIYNRDYIRKCAQKKYPWKALSDGPSENVRSLFNSNMTKVYFIKWSQNCTISGVVVIPKYLKNACKAGYFNFFGYAKNTTSDCLSSILRSLYNRYFLSHYYWNWSLIYTGTITNVFFESLFPIIILIVNLFSNLDHEAVELSLWQFLRL